MIAPMITHGPMILTDPVAVWVLWTVFLVGARAAGASAFDLWRQRRG